MADVKDFVIHTKKELTAEIKERRIFVRCGDVTVQVKRTHLLKEMDWKKYKFAIPVRTIDGEYNKLIYINSIDKVL